MNFIAFTKCTNFELLVVWRKGQEIEKVERGKVEGDTLLEKHVSVFGDIEMFELGGDVREELWH